MFALRPTPAPSGSGRTLDPRFDGTAWGIGDAYPSGTYVIGLHTDWRRRFDDESVNLTIEPSCDKLVHSLDELVDALEAWTLPV